MKTTGASEERIEQAVAVLTGDYGYTNLGAKNVVGIVCHIVVKPGELAVDVADLRRLYFGFETIDPDDHEFLERIAALIGDAE